MKPLKDLYKRPQFWVLDPQRTKIKPFPGKWPTRWKIEFKDRHGRLIYKFLGKPDSKLLPALQKRCKSVRGQVVLTEFDLGGPIRIAAHGTPCSNPRVNLTSPLVLACYYPWSSAGYEFFCPYVYPLFNKQIKFGGRTFFVYSPYKMMTGEREIEALRSYRTWLKTTNPLK